ncbi:MAG TPA: GntR family transcriptional regulator [Cryobacterium sp.]|nr:GntR family transcriptional regulator [Cryobacterium sp.]
MSIGADLADRVANGEFADGFPGELDLAEAYGVSRGTIRSALRPLREAGFVSAQRGRKPRAIVGGMGSAFGPVYSLFASVQESGMTQRSVVLERRIVTDPVIAARLALPPTEELLKLSRLRLADEEPFAVDHVWLPADRVRPLLDVDFAETALYKELRDRCGITVDGGVEELRADTAAALDVERLGCALGAPMFRIQRIGYHRGTAVELRCSHILGERYSVTAVFGAGVPGS